MNAKFLRGTRYLCKITLQICKQIQCFLWERNSFEIEHWNVTPCSLRATYHFFFLLDILQVENGELKKTNETHQSWTQGWVHLFSHHTVLYWFHDLSSQYQTTTLKHCPNATQDHDFKGHFWGNVILDPFSPFGRHGCLSSPLCEGVRICGARRRQQELKGTVILTVHKPYWTVLWTFTNTIWCITNRCSGNLNRANKTKRWALAWREVSQKQSVHSQSWTWNWWKTSGHSFVEISYVRWAI